MAETGERSRSVRRTSAPTLCAIAAIAALLCALGPAVANSVREASAPPIAPAPGHVFFVSPEGTPSGDGSAAAPWDLQTALSGPSVVVPGSTIWLRAGRYAANAGGPYGFSTALKGKPDAPITVAAYPGERATLDAAGNSVAALLVGSDGTSASDAIFRDFEVTSSKDPPGGKTSGLWIRDSTRVVFANLVVHDLPGQGIGFWIESTDSAVTGCLVYYNGSSSLEHGIYAGNAGPKPKIIRDNVFLYNYGYGIHVYGSGPRGAIDRVVVEGNIAAQNGRLVDTGDSKSPSGNNLLVGGDAPGDACAIVDNATYWAPWPAGAAWKDDAQSIGFSAPLTHLTISGNTFVGRTLFRGIESMTMAGNTFVRGVRGLTAAAGRPGNAYPVAATGTRVIIRPNPLEKGRANVAVYNPAKRPRVLVDLSTVLTRGARYEIRNAFDVYAPPVAAGLYAGGSVGIPMTGLSIARPAAYPTPPSVAPGFGAFIVRTLDESVPGPPRPRAPARRSPAY